MKSDRYNFVFNKQYLMGPNCMLLLEELIEPHLQKLKNARVMDLGCGQGVTSLYLAKETEARQIFSVDLWIDATTLEKNFTEWEMDDNTFPIHADANDLPFGHNFFDAVVSVDSYHYFGREKGFFAEKIWPLVKPGGMVCLCMPGLKHEFNGEYPELMVEWAGEEAQCFHSKEWWQEALLSGTEGVKECIAFESALADKAWKVWFDSGHEYALQDKAFFDRGLGEYVNFVSIVLQKE